MLRSQDHSRRLTRLFAAVLSVLLSATLMVVATGTSDAAPVVNPQAGKLVAKTDFQVKRDGFSFENWGSNTPQHTGRLTIEGLRAVLGDEVCARIVLGVCSPTTVAELTVDTWNKVMSGGHCFGMAALAGLYSTKRLNQFPLGLPWQPVYGLQPSPALDDLIARLFVTQGFPPTAVSLAGLPARDVLSRLQSSWARKDNYVLAIFSDEEHSAGHAITPIAIRDLGSGKRGIVVYDNNFPGVEKMVVVDPAADSWYYSTATNPDEPTMLYQGSPTNRMMLVPLGQILARHQDPDMASDDTVVKVSDLNGGAEGVGDVDWDARITDLNGRPIPGVERNLVLNNDNAVIFQVPAGKKFRIVFDGVEAGRTADLYATVLSNGGAVAMGDLELPAGAAAAVDVDPIRHSMRVVSSAPSTAEFEVATENSLRSVSAATSQLAVGPGSAVTVSDTARNGMTVRTEGRAQRLEVAVERSDVLADRVAVSRAVNLRAGATLEVPVNTWTGWTPLTATVRGAGPTTTVPMTVK